MFKKILVANRGEIAVRVIRACREMGIETVAVSSEADVHSLHVKLADESYCIGPAAPGLTYLNIPRIMNAAEVSGAQAIHPGYGFLSENERFVEVCEAHKLTFIGPSKEAIAKMGNKSVARETAVKAKAPIVPGSGLVDSVEEALEQAKKIGFPLLIKAARGGGGKGMRAVQNKEELPTQFQMARVEAEASFGSGEVYLEKLIQEPRHVEIQILGDKQGNLIYLGERDCSIQRRNQKLVEESPCPVMTPPLRKRMGEAALKVAASIGYYSAGTIEFLLDKNGDFYFMEMNTRIQVEHPVTEMVTGMDLLKAQIQVAAGESLSIQQEEVPLKGHAIECRINAENPDREFMPSPGEITLYLPPGGPGVRVDSHAYAGYQILPYYDSLIAKLIVHGKDRAEAIAKMKRALHEYVVSGIFTTIPFHEKVMDHPAFQKGEACTNFIPLYFIPEKLQEKPLEKAV